MDWEGDRWEVGEGTRQRGGRGNWSVGKISEKCKLNKNKSQSREDCS